MSTAEDEHLIQDIIAEQQAAWNAGNANAYAARFHVEGSFTNVFGDRYYGRDSFRERHAAVFNTFAKGSKASLTVRRIHFPVPGMAVVDIACTLQAYKAVPPQAWPTRRTGRPATRPKPRVGARSPAHSTPG